jgi:hypothetical protein
VCQLGKLHYHHQYGIISLWFWQTCDEVHTYTMLWPRRDMQWLQEFALLLVRGSVHLAFTQVFTKWAITSSMYSQWYLFDTIQWWMFFSSMTDNETMILFILMPIASTYLTAHNLTLFILEQSVHQPHLFERLAFVKLT